MIITSKDAVHDILKKGDRVVLHVVMNMKGKSCFEHTLCEDDPLLPGEIGERGSVRIFSPYEHCITDFSFGEIWNVEIGDVKLTNIFLKEDRRIIWIRVRPLKNLSFVPLRQYQSTVL